LNELQAGETYQEEERQDSGGLQFEASASTSPNPKQNQVIRRSTAASASSKPKQNQVIKRSTAASASSKPKQNQVIRRSTAASTTR
jgi:hypothetical protein